MNPKYIPYSGKLSREKTFANFTVCGNLRKFSLQNLGAWRPLARQKWVIRESFLCENHIFHQSAKVFSLESFPLYNTTCRSEIYILKINCFIVCKGLHNYVYFLNFAYFLFTLRHTNTNVLIYDIHTQRCLVKRFRVHIVRVFRDVNYFQNVKTDCS